jgi:hypothetical protein
MSTHETLRTEAEARRAVARRPADGRYTDAVTRYLGACDYASYEATKEQKEPEGTEKNDEPGEAP